MIKKIIGFVVTLAVLAVVVFTFLGFGTYESLLPVKWFESIQTDMSEETVEEPDADTLVDLSVQSSVQIDSLQIGLTEEVDAE